jgi:hypothetical protein
LELKTPLLGLICAAAGQRRTANPAKFEGAGVSANPASLDGVGQMGQPLRPAKTVEDVDP